MCTDQSSRPLLLLVDDNAQIRELLGDVGEREGFEVLEAADGLARVRALLAAMRQQYLDRHSVLEADATLAERLEVCGPGES